jgi:hypothetical protein
MNVEQIREIWASEPFKPLTIHMVDGKAVQVPHPDHLFFVPDSDMLFVVSQEEGRRKYRFVTSDQIASIER